MAVILFLSAASAQASWLTGLLEVVGDVGKGARVEGKAGHGAQAAAAGMKAAVVKIDRALVRKTLEELIRLCQVPGLAKRS